MANEASRLKQQIDNASKTVKTWSEWKKESLRAQITDRRDGRETREKL